MPQYIKIFRIKVKTGNLIWQLVHFSYPAFLLFFFILFIQPLTFCFFKLIFFPLKHIGTLLPFNFAESISFQKKSSFDLQPTRIFDCKCFFFYRWIHVCTGVIFGCIYSHSQYEITCDKKELQKCCTMSNRLINVVYSSVVNEPMNSIEAFLRRPRDALRNVGKMRRN